MGKSVLQIRKVLLLLGCPKMTQVLKCYAPEAFSGAKFQVLMENSNKS